MSLVPVFLAFAIMATMTRARMAEKMRQYGNALAAMSNEAVEYVRGIPVVKTFGQSVFSFKKFKAAIDEYEKWVIAYTKELRLPMMFYTAAIKGIHTAIGTNGVYLSAGEQQRIAIARAMLKNAPILILDEATASFFYTQLCA